jgi:ribonuclease D
MAQIVYIVFAMSEAASRFVDPSRRHRASHRDRMHVEAHAQEDAGNWPILDHPLVSRAKPAVIGNDADLAELLADMRQTGSFAYDSEFIGELTYVPKLCLLQAATTRRVALIDPLAGANLMPFWQLICDPGVEKIVHAGEQDIEPVIRLAGRAPANLLDTQVLAGFTGLAYPSSLQKLVHAVLGFKLGKGLTFTHWDQRPLSAMQLRYAADDVRYLPALAAELTKKAQSAGNLAFALAECARRCDPELFRSDPSELFTRIRGASNLSRTQLAILRELCIWRDATARAEDIPTRALLRDEVLIGIVRTALKEPKDLAKVRGLPRPVASRFADEIFHVVHKVHDLPVDQRPEMRVHEEGPAERFQIDGLWARVQCACYERQIDPSILGSRQQIADLYWRRQSGKSVDDHPLMLGWRKEIMPQL